MVRPFRFGVAPFILPSDGWIEQVRHIEDLGYSSVLWPDHFSKQWEPVAALAAVAAVTERLRVGSLVYSVDYRHPVVLAKAAATIHLLSGGRHELGIGAGWSRTDYDSSGIRFDPPRVRIERLEEALTIIRSMWDNETTSFSGKHYQIQNMPQAADLPNGERPRLLVGGGGRRVLAVAARHADIVSICPRSQGGTVTSQGMKEMTVEGIRTKTNWVREVAEAAGRRFDEIELNSYAYQTTIIDDPEPIREQVAKTYEMTVDELAECPFFLIGSAREIQEQLKRLREETGISYFGIIGRDMAFIEQCSEAIVKPLT
jgi:probable F420-dependent oxidoreductase